MMTYFYSVQDIIQESKQCPGGYGVYSIEEGVTSPVNRISGSIKQTNVAIYLSPYGDGIDVSYLYSLFAQPHSSFDELKRFGYEFKRAFSKRYMPSDKDLRMVYVNNGNNTYSPVVGVEIDSKSKRFILITGYFFTKDEAENNAEQWLKYVYPNG